MLKTKKEFVVIGFGTFFVFSEKQAPDRKMRIFYKTVAKPAAAFNKRLSSTSSSPSQQVSICRGVVAPTNRCTPGLARDDIPYGCVLVLQCTH